MVVKTGKVLFGGQAWRNAPRQGEDIGFEGDVGFSGRFLFHSDQASFKQHSETSSAYKD